MAEDKKPEEKKTEAAAKPASPAAKPATPAAKKEEAPPEPPKPGEFGQLLDSLKLKSEPLGDNASGIEMLEVEAKDFVTACTHLKKKGMKYLSNMTALELKKGFQVIAQLENMEEKKYVQIKATVAKDNPIFPSLTKLYASADWLEREAWDLVGVKFEGHPDLKRILNPEDWEGHPLRKDYIGPIDELNQPLTYKN